MHPAQAMTDQPPAAPERAATPARATSRAGAAWRVLRPLLFTMGAGALVVVLTTPAYNPLGPRFEYALRAAVTSLVVLGAVAWWWSHRRGRSWGADLAPAVVGAIAALTVAGSLNRTPYALGGLSGDQTFRTAAITRFADTWHTADFTFQGLPSFYAPAYFWVLGRMADLGGVEAWRMAKVGTVLATLAVPLVTYLLWRRLVPVHTAALIAVVPLAVENLYEPYAWLVLFAIVPWWLEAVHGLRRDGRPVGHPLFLGVVGALLFLTYYYFFFIAAIAFAIHLVVERLLGQLHWRRVGRAALVLAIAATASAVYWLPLAVSILQAGHAQSLANRWFSSSHPRLPLPMAEASLVGVVALAGLVYLVWTVRSSALSRGLLVLLVAAYGWYLLGAAAVAADTPLLSFRGKPLVPLILLIGGVLALVRLAQLATQASARFRAAPADVRRVGWTLGAVLVIVVGQAFVSDVRDSPLTGAAHATALPDGALPPHHADGSQELNAPDPPPAELRAIIDEQAHADGAHPVLLSDRVDLLALYPYFGFLQWNAHYAHPAAEFHQRAEFLQRLAGSADPAAFAAGAAANPYDPIDVFVLRVDGDELVHRFADDAFPAGTRTAEVRFPRALFSEEHFQLTTAGDHLVAVRR